MKRKHYAVAPALALPARKAISALAFTPDHITELPPGARIGRSRIGKARNKFGARRTPCRAGHVHASTGEAGRCDELHLLQRAGKISRLEQQPRFPLVVENGAGDVTDVGTYVADFRYWEYPPGSPRARCVVEDFKGADAPVNRLRRKLAEALHGIQVRVIRKG